MFVERTPDESLLEALKAKERELSPLVGYHTKIVEKNGLKLEQILVQQDPWKGWDCGRADCVVCIHKPQNNTRTDCSRESVTYRALCLNCKNTEHNETTETEVGIRDINESTEPTADEEEGGVEYIGESCKSLFTRGLKHEDNYRLLNNDSFMLRHHMEDHPDVKLGEVRFQFSVIKFHQTCFRRQIHEAVEIKLSTSSHKKTLNNKLEFNRSILPSLGDRDPTQEEKDRDREIIRRIKEMKEKWIEIENEGRKLLNKNERKQIGQKRGLPPLSARELEMLDPKTMTNKEKKWLVINQAVPGTRTTFYENRNLEELYQRILLKDMTGHLYQELKPSTDSTDNESAR